MQISNRVSMQTDLPRYWDDTAKAPYLWNPAENTFISYEYAESIKLKIEYLKNLELAGVMFWEYSSYHDKKLLNAVIENLHYILSITDFLF